MSIRDNLQAVMEAVSRAAGRSGRGETDVRIIAASKYVDAGRMLEAAEAGVRIFGENRVQEARDKMGAITWPEETSWHLIGHLQRNKAKLAASIFQMIHSVDNLALADALNRYARDAGVPLPVLVEINIGNEESKAGFSTDEASGAVSRIAGMEYLRVEGLMAIPPYSDNPEKVRPYFRMMRDLRDRMSREYPGIRELSMGMSSDFEVAVEEGATMVRLGTAIFGQRPVK